jgi:hypothetical protein
MIIYTVVLLFCDRNAESSSSFEDKNQAISEFNTLAIKIDPGFKPSEDDDSPLKNKGKSCLLKYVESTCTAHSLMLIQSELTEASPSAKDENSTSIFDAISIALSNDETPAGFSTSGKPLKAGDIIHGQIPIYPFDLKLNEQLALATACLRKAPNFYFNPDPFDDCKMLYKQDCLEILLSNQNSDDKEEIIQAIMYKIEEFYDLHSSSDEDSSYYEDDGSY